MKISPSVLAADFSRLADEVAGMERAGAEYLHLDVMDGIFVPNISFGFPVIESLRAKCGMVFDVHLMIARPELYFDRAIKAGADIVTFHFEASRDPAADALAIRKQGCRASVSIKPGTPVSVLYPYLDLFDMFLIMTVEPGYGGQKLIPETIGKVRALREELNRRNLRTEIEVDGGVNRENAGLLAAAGADVLVAGSALFRASDRTAAVSALRNAVKIGEGVVLH